ncbi:AAA family ATPase [Erwiniaceae bacterium L1_54_6]|nr:AAA family ATPase [Erwiniaceae bacterium L1_54_6]
MSLSREVRRLQERWGRGDFPKHIEWVELDGIRGWTGQRVDFKFPMAAIVGENGVGKSTILQAVAALYESTLDTKYYASTFFPDTPWESVTGCTINGSVREGQNSTIVSVKKPTTRWRGNDTRKKRPVIYLDLRRLQPIYSRLGFARLAKPAVLEHLSTPFDPDTLKRFSSIIGKNYTSGKSSTTNIDINRAVPVVEHNGLQYSGFHQGAGESTIAELMTIDIPEYSIVLIDEIETSLHPRAQRRLIRDLANVARVKRFQVIMTTHSPYVLEELPTEARIYVFNDGASKAVVPGVSPEFSLTKMDEENHPEVDIYVEDESAKIWLSEIIATRKLSYLARCKISTFGAASVGKALGTMVATDRFERPTIIVLDGDQDESAGCFILPGEEAPERLIFNDLEAKGLPDVATKISRSHADLVDAVQQAILLPDHHDWVKYVADKITIGGNDLWRAFCTSWMIHCADQNTANDIIEQIEEHLSSNSSNG